MIELYPERDFERIGYINGRTAIDFLGTESKRPEQFVDKTMVELLTDTESIHGVVINQVKLDEESGLYYLENFAVNYGSMMVDSGRLVRGFVPEGDVHRFEKQTLYEIMPNKKELHVIPKPARRLFYELDKVTSNRFCAQLTLDKVLEEFRNEGFKIVEFPEKYDSLTNRKNRERYTGEKIRELFIS